ncbi:MAG: exodeoxyribonuclease III [Dehalococcoidia bacterium]|nr:exodeoxyribonuclease III [Dehalococcoidia bacterium]MQG15458.1 exodeoxyribonuclease III [SAR202 cluster bacterium]|tara:strand:- start:51917 stop:52678 length:762 start_codon:yes stop_codon:yes gene_type:complete
MRLISWNINGIRAAFRKGSLDNIANLNADILCVQELKAQRHQMGDGFDVPAGYEGYWSFADRKGYSGVATFTKSTPLSSRNGFGLNKFDSEGRTIITEFEDFTLYNIYFPNGQSNADRLNYKLDFYDSFLRHCVTELQQGKKLIVCGDFNTAHKEIDLARPKQNQKTSGFLEIERKWIDSFIENGFEDVFRKINKEPNWYTYWDQKSRARTRNVGWRIDYFFVHKSAMNLVKSAKILNKIEGSDHCPIVLDLV